MVNHTLFIERIVIFNIYDLFPPLFLTFSLSTFAFATMDEKHGLIPRSLLRRGFIFQKFLAMAFQYMEYVKTTFLIWICQTG